MAPREKRSLALALAAALSGCAGGNEPPPPSRAAITVRAEGGAAAGIDVVFHDQDGAPTVHLVTGDSGRVEAEIEEGAMITVLFGPERDRLGATFLGVEGGDELELLIPRLESELLGTAWITVPPYSGAVTYVIQAKGISILTSNIGAPIDMEVREHRLAPDGSLPLLVTAFDAGGAVACAWLRGVAWADPMNVTMPSWSAPATYAVEATGVPSGAFHLGLALSYDVDGLAFDGRDRDTPVEPGGSASLTTSYAPGFGDRLRSRIEVTFGTPGEGDGASVILEQRTTLPATRSIDLGAELLPRVPPPVYDTADPTRPAIAWAPVPSLATTDGGAVSIMWIAPDDSHHEWHLLVPPDAGGAVRLPALPAELASWAPDASASFDLTAVQFVDADWLASYDELRRELGLRFVIHVGGPAGFFPDGDAKMRITMSARD